MPGGTDKVSATAPLESKPNCQLQLPRVANAQSQEPVKVRQRRCRQWIYVVLVVEGIEHLDDRDQLKPFAKSERSL